MNKLQKNRLYSTPEAALVLGISPPQFRKLAERLEPADWYVNPHYKSGPMCPKWRGRDLRRVRRWIAFKEMVERRNNGHDRKEAASKGRATKQRKLEEYIDGLEITIPTMPLEQLFQISKSEALQLSRDMTSGDRESLARYAVNYLRHACPSYDTELRRLAGHAFKELAYLQLRDRVLEKIAELYPELEEECWRQRNQAYKRVFS